MSGHDGSDVTNTLITGNTTIIAVDTLGVAVIIQKGEILATLCLCRPFPVIVSGHQRVTISYAGKLLAIAGVGLSWGCNVTGRGGDCARGPDCQGISRRPGASEATGIVTRQPPPSRPGSKCQAGLPIVSGLGPGGR